MSNEFEVIFDASTVRESLGLSVEPAKADVVLKMDQPLWAYEPPSAVPSDLVKRLESDDFVDAIAGESVSPETALGGFDALDQFRKAIPIPVALAPAAGTEIRDLMKSLGKRAWGAPAHRSELKEIIDKFRNSPICRPIRDDDRWNTLLGHCTDYVAQTVLEAGSLVS